MKLNRKFLPVLGALVVGMACATTGDIITSFECRTHYNGSCEIRRSDSEASIHIDKVESDPMPEAENLAEILKDALPRAGFRPSTQLIFVLELDHKGIRVKTSNSLGGPELVLETRSHNMDIIATLFAYLHSLKDYSLNTYKVGDKLVATLSDGKRGELDETASIISEALAPIIAIK